MREKISVKKYIENKELLDAYYTPYQQKCIIVNGIIDALRIDDNELIIIDYAQLQPMKDSIFIEAITNLDMITADEDGYLPYDQLKSSREFSNLINSIRDEYEEFNNILDLNIKTIKEHNSIFRIINEIKNNIIEFTNQLEGIDLSSILEKEEDND